MPSGTRLILALICAVGLSLVPPEAAWADPIQLIKGDYDGVRPIVTTTSSLPSTIIFTDVLCQEIQLPDCFGTAEFLPDGPPGLRAHELRISLEPFPATIETREGPVELEPIIVSAFIGGTLREATFVLTNGQLTSLFDETTMGFTAGMITATARLDPLSNTFGPDVDLSLFEIEGNGIFVATYTGIFINPNIITSIGEVGIAQTGGFASWDNRLGSTAPVTAHFELRALEVIPEPATLAMCSWLPLAGLACLVRRWRKAC